MVKKISLTSLWVFLSTVLGAAQIKKVTIEVEGLDIAYWAAKLEDNLKKVSGVAKVRMFPPEDRVELERTHNVKVDLEKIGSAVHDASFFLQYWGLEVTGHVVNWEGEPPLFIPEDKVKLLLGASCKETEERLQKLMEKHIEQAKVSVTGTLQKVVLWLGTQGESGKVRQYRFGRRRFLLPPRNPLYHLLLRLDPGAVVNSPLL